MSRNSTGWGYLIRKTNLRLLANKHTASCSSFLPLGVELAKTRKLLEVSEQYQFGMAGLALLNVSTSVNAATLTTTAIVNAIW